MASTSTILELLRSLSSRGATDLIVSAGRPARVRVDGEVVPVDGVEVSARDVEGFLDGHVSEPAARGFREAGDLDVAVALDGGERFRVSFLRERGRLGLVARVVPSGVLGIEQLGLPPDVAKLAEARRGLVLVTGPADSGKSTTLAALLNHVNAHFARHIVTVEDPIEFVHEDRKSVVTQREVGSDTESFRTSLRHVLRQSPDALFIGEVRDAETVQVAISAVLTGHLVVTTVHTPDVAGTVERLINLFPDQARDQVAADLALALVGVVSQRLVRRKEGPGRVVACEVLVATPRVRHLVRQREPQELRAVMAESASDGMQTFTRSLVDLCREGEISPEAGASAATDPEEFLLAVQGVETGIETLRARPTGDAGSKINIRNLLRAAVRHGASDLILTAQKPPVLRIDGALKELNLPPLDSDATRRLLFSVLDPAQRLRLESDREIDFALSLGGLGEDDVPPRRFRVNGFYQKGAIASVLRLVPGTLPTADALHIPGSVLELALERQGLFLVTGPTGHGKSTTLAALIDSLNSRRACHVVTVEDPIEYVHESRMAVIEQREVGADTRSFAVALRRVLRQDPDVILVGELRDAETVSAALTAAETGHLVLATLHTNDAAQTIDRMIDLFPPHQQDQARGQLASALLAVTSQRLLPRKDGSGRVPAFEILKASPPARALIRENRTFQLKSVIETSGKLGMVTLDQALESLARSGAVTSEAIRPWSTETP